MAYDLKLACALPASPEAVYAVNGASGKGAGSS